MGEIAQGLLSRLRRTIASSNQHSYDGVQKYVLWENIAIKNDYELLGCSCADDCWCRRHGCQGHYCIKSISFDQFLDSYVGLGVPLGTVVVIKGKHVKSLRRIDEGKEIISVRSVNGKPLEDAVEISVERLGWQDYENVPFGSTFDAIGYEDGMMVGLPTKAHKMMPSVAEPSWHFRVSFVLVEMRKSQ